MVEECACCAESEAFDPDGILADDDVTTSVVVYEERTPVPVRGGALVQAVRQLPAPVVKTAAAVAVGAAVQIGVVLAGKYIATQAAQQSAKSLAASGRNRKKRDKVEDPGERDGMATLTETLIVRRVWVKRDRD